MPALRPIFKGFSPESVIGSIRSALSLESLGSRRSKTGSGQSKTERNALQQQHDGSDAHIALTTVESGNNANAKERKQRYVVHFVSYVCIERERIIRGNSWIVPRPRTTLLENGSNIAMGLWLSARLLLFSFSIGWHWHGIDFFNLDLRRRETDGGRVQITRREYSLARLVQVIV